MTKLKTMAKERPLPMDIESIEGIRAGRKTMFRSVLHEADQHLLDFLTGQANETEGDSRDLGQILEYGSPDTIRGIRVWCGEYPEEGSEVIVCPHGLPGDRLWLQEDWRIESFMPDEPLLFGYRDGGTMLESPRAGTEDYEAWYERICIESTDDAEYAFKRRLVDKDSEDYYTWYTGHSPCRWRYPLYMPRWASRITLLITDVRIERLQEITRTEAHDEGVKQIMVAISPSRVIPRYKNYMTATGSGVASAIESFASFWEFTNKSNYSWNHNPWVFAIGFKVLESN